MQMGEADVAITVMGSAAALPSGEASVSALSAA